MKIICQVIGLLFLCQFGMAQVADDFSDGNFTANPVWEGNTADFIVNTNKELQLNAAVAGISKLYTQVAIGDSNVWEFYMKYDFSPSSSNGGRIYLQAAGTDLTNTQGYFLEVGETGSNDALSLYRQDGATKVFLKKATLGTMGGTSAVANVRVVRNAAAEWTLYADYTGGTNYAFEFSVSDATYLGVNGYFGIYCNYTLSNKNRFYFDNIKLRKLEPDVTPPSLLSVSTLSNNSLRLIFDESIQASDANNVSNYSVDKGIGNPSNAVLNPDLRTVVLTFANGFVSGENYQLTVSNMRDLAGNRTNSQTKPFSYVNIGVTQPFDIVINEIMADPTPLIGLPDAEYIEILNRSNKNLDLSQLRLKDVTKDIPMPSYIMKPGEYIILCAADKRALLGNFGYCLPISDFLSLTNSGKEIMLVDNLDIPIHIVNYSDTWYPSTAKKEGGWSLEMINPNEPCTGDVNWTASNDLRGGTPGTQNSVFVNTSNAIGPQALSIFPIDATNLEIVFDKALLEFNISDISFNPSLNVQAINLDPTKKVASVILNSSLSPNQVYVGSLKVSLKDCVGTANQSNQEIKFGLPSEAAAKDLIINEILANPVTGGYDYVEILNISNKIIDMSKLNIGNVQPGFEDIKSIEIKKLILPGDFAVFTENPTQVKNQYTVKNPEFLYQIDLPTWDDKGDNITLYTTTFLQSIILDSVNYTDAWHYPLLKDENGVSLERISPTAPTQSEHNWHSAASSVGYGTPTYQNSQFRAVGASGGNKFSLSDKSISPNEDGIKDFLLIEYKDMDPNTKCNIHIYDAAGRRVSTLVAGELLGSSGQYVWDGTLEEGVKARGGIYIFLIEYFTSSGQINRQKETCIVGYGQK